MLLVFVTLLLAQQAFAGIVNVKDCGMCNREANNIKLISGLPWKIHLCLWVILFSLGSGLGVIQSVDVAGCSGSSCNLVIGNSASMSLTFSSGVDTSKLTSKVAGVILGLEVPFPLPEPNSCLLGELSIFT